MSRPSEYSQATADAICERIADGESLRSICAEEGMPNKSTVFRWLEALPDFATKYARAREFQADSMADDIVDIADTTQIGVKTKTNEKGEVETTEGDMIEHRKLRIAARQWTAEKLRPKKYGPKLEIDQRTTLTDLTEEQLDARIAQLRTATGG
jgi:hypothetical protein